MAYDLEKMLVVGVASSALFNLSDADSVFREHGEAVYREYQETHIDEALEPGVAFPFIKRLLSLNDLAQGETPLVEVIVLSSNDPETGLRVMRSIAHHDLPISRAIFMQGRSPFAFMGALNMSLFLSQNKNDVRIAISKGFAAGQVLGLPAADLDGTDLRIAFDFDGVLADDSSERVMQTEVYQRFTQMRQNALRNLSQRADYPSSSAASTAFKTLRRNSWKTSPTITAEYTSPSSQPATLRLTSEWSERFNRGVFASMTRSSLVESRRQKCCAFSNHMCFSTTSCATLRVLPMRSRAFMFRSEL